MAEPAAVTPPPVDPALSRARDLMNKLWNDPKLGADVRKAAKEQFPDIVLPDDQINPVVAPIKAELDEVKAANKALLDRLDKRDKEETERAAQLSLEQKLDAARKKFSLTDEGFDKMVARMKAEGNFTDAESAAAWVAHETPPPKPAQGPSWSPQALDLYGSNKQNDDYKLLHTNTEAFFDQTVQQILNEAAA